jgi:hypothetical protein
MRVSQLPDHDAAAFHGDFEAAEFGGGVLQSVISDVEAVQKVWVSWFIKSMGAQKEVKGPNRLRHGSDTGIGVVGEIEAWLGRLEGRSVVPWRRRLRIFHQSCGSKDQVTVPYVDRKKRME